MLAYVSETDGPPQTRLGPVSGGSSRVLDLQGTVFPAAADPRGTHLLVIRTEEGPAGHQEALWMVPLGEGAPLRIGPIAEAVRNPSWSPDGGWLVFESSHESFRDLYRISRDGSGFRRLTSAPHGSFEPAVASDGRIAFVSSRDGNAEVYVRSPDGRVERVTNDPTDDMQPAWSPDGQVLTWLRREGSDVHLWQFAGGKKRPFLPPVPGEQIAAQAWSPDGVHLALTVHTNREVAVHIVGEQRVVLDGAGPDEHPSWSPDGKHLVFSSARNGNPDLYRVAVDGSGLTQITHDAKAAWLPRWLAPGD